MAPALATLKNLGRGSGGLLSFPIPGWTLAVDLPARWLHDPEALRPIDKLVAAAGGRVYLAKDALSDPDLIPVMYPRLAGLATHAGPPGPGTPLDVRPGRAPGPAAMTDGTALLVGGSSEIGIAVLTELLGPPPRRVVLAGRPSGELWWNAEKLRDLGYSVTTAQYDACLRADEVDGMLEHACADHPLSLAVVAVGTMTEESFADGIVVNGLSVALLLRALVQRAT